MSTLQVTTTISISLSHGGFAGVPMTLDEFLDVWQRSAPGLIPIELGDGRRVLISAPAITCVSESP